MKRPPQRNRLPRSFYDRPTAIVAQELLGKALVRKTGQSWVGGWIVETEAYLAEDDLASHSARGKTASNASMFDKPGTLYVYPIHAKHCLNAVTDKSDRGSAVLIRAIEPAWGIEQMQIRRKQTHLRRLTRGPAMICQALDVDRSLDGADLVRDSLITILAAEPDSAGLHGESIRSGARIGITKSQSLPLRFFVVDNDYVSGPVRDRQ